MTITEYASELADQVRAEGTDGPALHQALQLTVHMWLDTDRDGISEMAWGLFATEIQTIADQLYPEAPEAAVIVEPAELSDEHACNVAVRGLVDAAADVLAAASRQPDQPRAWEYATAAADLRAALGHLP